MRFRTCCWVRAAEPGDLVVDPNIHAATKHRVVLR